MSSEKETQARVAFIVAKSPPDQVEPGTPIGHWTPEVLRESTRRGCLPIVKLEWPDSLDVFRLSTVADIASKAVVNAMGSASKLGASSRDAKSLIPLPDDALIDQNDPRVPKTWFVRAAKAGRFPCSKEGRDYIARWSDVRAALALENMTPRVRKAGPRDDLREALGLKKKG